MKLRKRKKKMVFKQGDLILNFDRIRMDVTDFIRGNPITAVAVGLGVPLTFAGIAAVGKRVKRRKKKSVRKKAKRKSIRRRKTIRGRLVKRRKRVTHSSPRHKGHQRVAFTTKTGQKVSFLMKKPKHTHKRVKRRR